MFLQNYPELTLILGPLDARGVHPGLKKEVRIEAIQAYLTTKTHMCVQVALVNATFPVLCLEIAGKVQQLLELDKKIYKNLRKLGQTMERGQEETMWCRVQSNGDINKSIQDMETTVAFEEISQRKKDFSWHVWWIGEP